MFEEIEITTEEIQLLSKCKIERDKLDKLTNKPSNWIVRYKQKKLQADSKEQQNLINQSTKEWKDFTKQILEVETKNVAPVR